MLTRLLPPEMVYYAPEEEAKWDRAWNELNKSAALPNNVQQWQYDEFRKVLADMIAFQYHPSSE